MTTIGLKAQSKKFYVTESEITKEGAIVYCKSYESHVTIRYKKDMIEIKTDSVIFQSFILKYSTKSITTDTKSLLTAKREQIFFIKEFTINEKYYLVVIPVKLQLFHQNLGGHGKRLVISNVENLCDSINFVNK